MFGNAAEPAVLIQAHIADRAHAGHRDARDVEVRKMVEIARTLNPAIEVAVRSHNERRSRACCEARTPARVFVGENELATAMVAHVLRTVEPPAS